MGQASIAFVYVLGTLLTLVLYGIYFVTFTLSIYNLVQRRRSGGSTINTLLIGTNTILFSLISAVGISTKRIVAPFIGAAIESPLYMLFTGEASSSEYIAMLILLVAELAVSDIFLIYRLWIFSKRSWAIIIPPFFVLVAAIISESIFINNTRYLSADGDSFGPSGDGWLIAGLGGDVFVNVYSTGLLSYKIWRDQHGSKPISTYLPRSNSASNILIIIVESAAIYAACMVTILVLYICHSVEVLVLLDIAAPVIGIAFCLIIIRPGMGVAMKRETQRSTLGFLPNNSFSLRGNVMSMQSMAVHVDHPSFINDRCAVPSSTQSKMASANVV